MRYVDFMLAFIIFGLLFNSCLGQNSDKSYNASSVEPPGSGQPLQISNESVSYKGVNNNMLWLDDPQKVYSRMFCTSLVKGGWVKAEVVPVVNGDLIAYRKSLSGQIISQNMGSVHAGNQYDLRIHVNDGAWYNELWYSINGTESNHIWVYVYDKESSQYLR